MASASEVNPRLRADVCNEPNKMFQPISGYEDESVLPLEVACKPLEKILDKELAQNIMIAKMNSMEPEDGLTPDESASIHLYTMEWKISENSLYAVLNRTLRLADRRELRPWFKFLKLFLTAFFKLPASQHRSIWRGVPEDLGSLYQKGKKIAWWGVSSCTRAISVLQSAQYAGSSGPRTMFSIETNNGKLIQSHSYFQQEEEILLPPGIYLEVVDKFSSADGLNIIHLREIQAPYKFLADPFDLSQLTKALPESKSKSFASSSKKTEEKPSLPSVTLKPDVQPSSKEIKSKSQASNKVKTSSAIKISCTFCGSCSVTLHQNSSCLFSYYLCNACDSDFCILNNPPRSYRYYDNYYDSDPIPIASGGFYYSSIKRFSIEKTD